MGLFEPKAEIRELLTNMVCASHDIGKASKFFQDYLGSSGKNSGKKKAHSPLSALYAFYCAKEKFQDSQNVNYLSTLVASSVFAHHGKLESPAKVAIKLREWGTLIQSQINSIDESHLLELDEICESLNLPRFSEFKTKSKEMLDYFVKIQGSADYGASDLRQFYSAADIFSTLIDADRLDAAELGIQQRSQLKFETIKDNIGLVQQKSKSNVGNKIVELRELLFEHIRRKVEFVSLESKIISLTAPTGSGKTLTGLYFALRLRERLERQGRNPRIIYVAPFLSIIDQTSSVFREAIGEVDSMRTNTILEHHHLCEMVYAPDEDTKYSTDKSALLIEGWNSEVIVTTLMQFAFTILGRSAKQLMKFHNLAGSIVLLDEVQAIPAEYWELFRSSLKFLSEFYDITFILMTATQPLIFDKNEILEIGDLPQYINLVDRCKLDLSALKSDGSEERQMNIDEFAATMISSLNGYALKLNVMVVLNTIGSAATLFDKLCDSLSHHELYFLSAEVIPKERKERIARIKQSLENNRNLRSKPVLLVSTQLIEAGIDLDFDVVFRDFGPMDSIIQCAGRCNRHGLRSFEESKTSIVELVDENGKPFSRKVYGNVSIVKTKKILLESGEESFSRLSVLYYNEMKTARQQKQEEKILAGIKSLDYDLLDEIKLIDETPGGSIFVELDEDAKEVYSQFLEIWKKKSKKPGDATNEFLKIRSRFYSYVINVPEIYLSHLGDVFHGIYHIDMESARNMYDGKGFVRLFSGVL